jgi:hypothetical protein
MPDPRHLDPDRIRVVLDHGEVVELDGGTLTLDDEESASVVLRLAPWRARSVARVLRSGRRYHASSTTRPGRISTSWTCHGHWSWPLRSSVMVVRRSCDPLADRASSQIGDVWLLWQSWASVRCTSPRFSALP